VKRPFFILKHNPDRVGSIDDKGSALHALRYGANALAPDIVCIENQFRVLRHNNPFETRKGSPTLSDYLAELADGLQKNSSLQLHLMVFGLKHTNTHPFKFETLQKIIRDSFSNKIQVAMVFNTPDNFTFLLNEVAPLLTENQALGTDEYNDPLYVYECFKWRGFAYIYAHGNSFLFHDVYKPIEKAVNIRDSGHSFRLVYPWVVDSKKNFRRYLDLGVDAIMTNEPERLRTLVEKEYLDKYEFKKASFETLNLPVNTVHG
jgi:glycerophosphoryl diester phosphodiesterase